MSQSITNISLVAAFSAGMKRMKVVGARVIGRMRNAAAARCFEVWAGAAQSGRRMKQVCAKVAVRLRNMCVARCFAAWVEGAAGMKRMKVVGARVIGRMRKMKLNQSKMY